MATLIVAIIGAVLLVLLIAIATFSRINVAGPNEAFIVTGRKGRAVRAADGSFVADLSGQKVVMGAAVFVMPVVQRLHRLDLSSREIPVSVEAAVSSQGIRCDADAVAIVKVGGTADDDPPGRAAVPAPAGPHRGIHRSGAVRRAACRRSVGSPSRRSSGTGPRSPRTSRRKPSAR